MKRFPFALTALAATMVAAHAQEAAAPASAASAPAAAASVPAAASATAPATTLPPVVVIGEKSARSLDKTAPSVKVWTEADLADNPGLRSQRALLDDTVNITSTGTQNLAPAVRGIDGTGPSQGSDAFLAGTRSRLNVVVDGRPASYNEITFGDLGLWDVSRVEVFRGAQSTLQGRNAIAGTVVYKTHDPSFVPEVGGRVAVGSFKHRQVSVLASGPIVDNEVAVRLSADRTTFRSFVKDYAGYPGVDDPAEFEASTLRGKLLLKPSALPGLRTLVTLSHTEYRGPQTEGVSRPFEDQKNGYPEMPVFAPRVTSGVVDTAWDLHNGWTFENSLVGGDFKVRRHAVAGDGNALIDGRDWSLEPRLRYANADKTLTALIGAYGFWARQYDTLDLFGGGSWNDRTTTGSLYGEATTALTPTLELTAGGRYEREHRMRKGTLAMFVTDFDERYSNFLPKLSLAWQADPLSTLGLALSRGYNGGNAGFTYEAPFTSYEYDAEYVWNLEGFARSRQWDGRLQLTGNVFYSRYKDYQTSFDLNPDPAVWAYVVRNAPRAETYGAEFDATWLALPGLKLRGSLGLLRARITRYPDSGVEGHELPRAPRVTTTLGAHWRHASGFELGGSARYSSAYHSGITNVPRGRVEPGWTVRLSTGYTVGRAKFFAYVNNVFDSQRPIHIEADPNATDDSEDIGMLPVPRSVGVGMEVWF